MAYKLYFVIYGESINCNNYNIKNTQLPVVYFIIFFLTWLLCAVTCPSMAAI